MKMSHLIGERFKERPADCVIDSHALMVRGGYMKYVANGIYASYPPLRRITRKIEQIIREEMDALGGQEVSMPVVLPASYWQQSGRYDTVGDELLRFFDRNEASLVLGMTHEEAAVELVREYGGSYAKYPFFIYQIQTKFRDERRPRGGLIRVREFTMKDGYSFHTSQADLKRFYDACLKAYHRIFQRVGLPEVVSVASDSGMMGGDISHEFMLLTPVGEDSIAICESCGYRANVETAPCVAIPTAQAAPAPLQAVPTPGMHTIEEVCSFLQVPQSQTCKAVAYQQESDGGLVVVFLRGDLEVNESKLTGYLGCGIRSAALTESSGLCAGFIGPYRLQADCTVLYDASLQNAVNLVCGGNQSDMHYTGLSFERDIGPVTFHDFAKATEGGICPHCGQAGLHIRRGIEVGNIFQLGDKYTRAMLMQYVDAQGESHYPLMGCYGIGVGRLAASVCEAHHDENGPIWPVSIAPWQVHLCAVRAAKEEVANLADSLYHNMQKAGIEVLYDDRPVSAGVMFADADLIGVPLRVVVSPRGCKEGTVELAARDKSFCSRVEISGAMDEIQRLLENMRAGCAAQ